MSTIEIIYLILCILAITTIVLPLIHKDHWVFRAFEFPRLQKFCINVFLIIFGLFIPFSYTWVQILQIVLLLGTIYSAYMIFPFTPLAPKSIKGISSATAADKVRILISNVYQPNNSYQKILDHIDKENPDLIFLVETDKNWTSKLMKLKERYPFFISEPLDNMYGLLFFSRLSVEGHKITYRVKDDIPGIDIIMKTPAGKRFKFFGVHPEPPSPTENPYSTDRDIELLKVANDCQNEKLPIIVAGDLNDVAWSYTTERFLEISRLKDPRRGRGIYATFHAEKRLLRWPLDHIFCSEHFKLVQMRRLRKIGSDHFPVYVELSLERSSPLQR